MELIKLKQIIEAALMASGEVLSIERLQLLFDDYEKPKSPKIKEALESLMEDFSDRGIELVEVASGYRLQVRKDVAPWVTRLWDEKPQRYSRALLETMSLIAYRQPITRGDIEDVRGVAVSSHIIRTLLDREWVRVVGHRDVPGRPAMYATTKEFLDYFSLKSLDELPSLDEIREMDDANQSLDLINAEKKASATREYEFSDEDDVAARGEEVLIETELELEEAAKLVQQVEDNVFNKPSEEELAAEREAERQTKAEEERLAEEATQTSFSEMANKTEQRLSAEDLSDRIASHQARIAGNTLDERDGDESNVDENNAGHQDVEHKDSVIEASTDQPEEGLTLLQQQELLMQQLMQDEAQRQQAEQAPAVDANDDLVETEQEHKIEEELLAEAEAEKELLAQEAAAERELLEQEALEKEALAEEALQNELDSEDVQTNFGSKKNSLFDD
jgi:segregation and condensation protein B